MGRHHRTRPSVVALLLRGLVAAGLAVDAVIHLHLAHGYELAAGGGIGEGTLFRIQAGLAIVLAVAIVVRGNRVVAVLAILIAAAALGAVVLYRYVDVPSFGPLPSMYEPVWFPEKTLSAVAEAVAALGALALVLETTRRRGRQGRLAIAVSAQPPTATPTRRRNPRQVRRSWPESPWSRNWR